MPISESAGRKCEEDLRQREQRDEHAHGCLPVAEAQRE
jgi:hypothetical protein